MTCVVAMFFARARAKGDAPFLWRKLGGRWQATSWAQAARQVASLAAGLKAIGLQPGDLTWAGVGFALLAGACWAAYILLSAQTGRRWQGIDGLAIASVVAGLLLTPLALGRYADQLADARILVIGALVGLLSSVIPHTCELVALRSLRPAVFSILMSLEPAVAALAGLVVVGEVLGPLQLLAMACVVGASVGATRSGATFSEPVPD